MIKKGDKVKVHYIGRLVSGEIFDTSMEDVAKEEGIYNPERVYEPIEFVVGEGNLIEGFEEAVVGMNIGDEKTVTIPAEKAYGERNEMLVQKVPASAFEGADFEPEVGMMILAEGIPAIITEVTDEYVTLDFNHELAGEDLVFTIIVVGKEDSE